MRKKVALLGVFLALALICSYIESLIPFYFGVPGMKLGLTNIVVVLLLYFYGTKEALAVSFMRILLAGFMFGQTVLVKACQAAKIPFDGKQAHSALYDTERTAELFCYMVNHLKELGGFPHIAQTNETEKTAENQTAL